MKPNSPRTIVLGSTSPFRKQILEKLNIHFETDKPEIDESAKQNETPSELVERLAIEKAKAVAERWPDAIVIGSDQVAVHQQQILGKPHTHANAFKQLTSFSGDKVEFLTGLAVIDTKTNKTLSLVEPFSVHFKDLTSAEIESYLVTEQPYNCAGSFKSEALGISLFERLVGDDPNTLVGLPLIKLVALFRELEFEVLLNQK